MRHLDLFSGIGGFALAARWCGWETVAFCEIDPYCQDVLRKHWPGVRVFDDVALLRGDQVGTIDVITGGFPCQDISTAGRGEGINGNRSGLWTEFARLIGECDPSFAVIENVPALTSRGLGVVLADLASLGFDAEWDCVPASAVGAPHKRDRIWIVAHAQRLGLPRPWQHEPRLHPTPDAFTQADRLVDAVREGRLPFMCRGHDGVPARVDRPGVKALGNAIVPQVAYEIMQSMAVVTCC